MFVTESQTIALKANELWWQEQAEIRLSEWETFNHSFRMFHPVVCVLVNNLMLGQDRECWRLESHAKVGVTNKLCSDDLS